MRPLFVAAFLLAACNTPSTPSAPKPAAAALSPEALKPYVGSWQGDGVEFTVDSSGGAELKHKGANTSSSFTGKITAIDAKSITLKILIVDKTIVLNEAPHQDSGRWTMRIDGVQVWKSETDRASFIAKKVRENFEGKGVIISEATCPPEANTASAFVCQLKTAVGDSVPINVLLEGDNIRFKGNAAILDPAKIQDLLAMSLGKSASPAVKKALADHSLAVDCGAKGNILKEVGATFKCKIPAGSHIITATLTVKTPEGGVDAQFSE